MDPTRIIKQLCSRYGVPKEFGERLRPLIVRATTREPDARQRIMDMIERSFVQEAERERMRERERASKRQAKPRKARSTSPNIARVEAAEVENRVLGTVAAILHGWDPPNWIERLGGAGE